MNPEEKKNHRGGARLQKPEKPQREKKPKPQRTRQQKVLRVLYIVLTVIAALIVAGFVIFHFMSAPPEVSGPTPTPQHTTVIDENGNEVEVEIPGLSADRKDQFYTFLLVGRDTGGGGNTDTIMVVSYDVKNQARDVKLYFALYADTREAWLSQYRAFIAMLKQGDGGWLDINFPDLEMTLRTFYKEASDYEPLTYLWKVGKQASRFYVTFREPVPAI